MNTPKPQYPLKVVKELLKNGHYYINPDAQQDAKDDFNWGPMDIKKCLLKLNARYFLIDREKNHFFKSAPHRHFPGTMMDYYKAKKIMQGFSVYTHFYIHPSDGTLTISSFKEL